MLKSHEKFHSSNGKRQILIADDELITKTSHTLNGLRTLKNQ